MDNKNDFLKTAPRLHFEKEQQKAGEAESSAQKQFNTFAIVRLGVFALALLSLWLWNTQSQPAWGAVAVLLIAVFLFLMKKHQAVKRERDFQRNLQTLNQDELNRLDFRFTRTDTGQQFQEKDHAYGADLDIFGAYSLYKLLNRTSTFEGSRRLANWLKYPASPDEITLRQYAAAEFRTQPGQMQYFEATALLHEHASKQLKGLRAWSTEKLPADLVSGLKWRWAPVLTLSVAALSVFNLVPGWAIVICLIIHFLILRRFLQNIQVLTNQTGAMGKTLIAYADLLAVAEDAPYQSAWWQSRKTVIAGSSKALLHLGMLFERLDYRNNVFFSLFVGLPLLWDLQCLAAIEKWKNEHHSRLSNWLDVLADMEAMNSLGGHAFANPACATPQVTDKGHAFVHTTNMGHPLIHSQKRVSNSFAMSGTGHTILVTGSNMSGKSTFLRTIGLNIVLAQMGAVVSADNFSCSPMRIVSSMRTQDSLEESTSSFYAELKRLRKLLELADEQIDIPVFYLLDEILKGTNSADRHRGAEALIRQLHTKNASGLVSTHDLELGEWGAGEDYVDNFHFRSDVEHGQLHFDYKLHDGICQSFNASELMRMMGIDIDLTNKSAVR
jgi:hypothetical protein